MRRCNQRIKGLRLWDNLRTQSDWATPSVLRPSGPVYYPTGDFHSCVSGGLRFEIIRVTVYHNSPANDIAHTKPARQHLTVSLAVITEQRWKITGMLRMRCPYRIVMTARVWKAAAVAVAAFMDMESKEARL